MINVRSAVADWFTIITSSITLYSLLFPSSLISKSETGDRSEVAMTDINIAAALFVAIVACLFFNEVSIRTANWVVKNKYSVVPDLGVYILFTFMGLSLYLYTQFKFHLTMFSQPNEWIITIPIILWILNLMGMIVRSVNDSSL